jgi:hypothetical protein
VEKTVKYNFAFCAAEDAGEEINFDSVLNLKYFIQTLKFRRRTQTFLWPPNFPSFSRGPLETWCDHLEGHTAHAKEEVKSHTQIHFLPQCEHPAPLLQRLVG